MYICYIGTVEPHHLPDQVHFGSTEILCSPSKQMENAFDGFDACECVSTKCVDSSKNKRIMIALSLSINDALEGRLYLLNVVMHVFVCLT